MATSQSNSARGATAPGILTITEAAGILGMSRRAISEAARTGKLDGVFGGLLGTRLIGITAESVNRIIDYRKSHQPICAEGDYVTRVLRPARR